MSRICDLKVAAVNFKCLLIVWPMINILCQGVLNNMSLSLCGTVEPHGKFYVFAILQPTSISRPVDYRPPAPTGGPLYQFSQERTPS